MDNQELLSIYTNSVNMPFILDEYIYPYTRYLQTEKDLNKSTINEVALSLNNFDKYLMIYFPELMTIAELEAYHVKAYISFNMHELLLKNRTINKKLRAIKYFLNYICNVRRIIPYNPSLSIVYLKVEDEKLPPYIPKQDLFKVLEQLESKKYGIRDSVVTKFLAYIGLDLKEILDLKMDQLDLINRKVCVTRKDIVYEYNIPDDLFISIKEYINIRNEYLMDDYTEYLFISIKGSNYTTRSYQYAFKEALMNSNIDKNYTPRNVKASFAYYMAQVVSKDKLKQLLNQDKVEHYYVDDLNINPLLPK